MMSRNTKKEEKVDPAEQKRLWKEITDKIIYSDRYSDDHYEYRHVTLPREIVSLIPKSFWNSQSETKVLRLLSEEEWRGIGIMQSPGWEHYEVHVPEPLILLFRRSKGYGTQDTAAATRKKK